MTIDPKLFKKYTGRNPGEAMTRLGQSLAKQKSLDGDTSILGALGRGRRRMAIVGGLMVAAAVIYLLATGGI